MQGKKKDVNLIFKIPTFWKTQKHQALITEYMGATECGQLPLEFYSEQAFLVRFHMWVIPRLWKCLQ
jgi:hypothetical protein